MKKIIIIILAILLVGMGFCFGAGYTASESVVAAMETVYITSEPEVITVNNTEYIHVNVYRDPEIITENITVEVEVEKIIYPELNYIPWQSKQEVEDWLSENWIPYKDDCITTGNYTNYPAGALMMKAAADNRLIGLFAKYPLGTTEWHCMNFFIVGNYVYEIEPWTGKIKGIWGTLD